MDVGKEKSYRPSPCASEWRGRFREWFTDATGSGAASGILLSGDGEVAINGPTQLLIVIACLVFFSVESGDRVFYAAPDGSAAGDGSMAAPWDLQTALSHPPSVQPGDTIYLRGGVYRGSYISKLMGAPDAPIVVRAYPGETAVIDWYRPYQLASAVSSTTRRLTFTEAVPLSVRQRIVLGGKEIVHVVKVLDDRQVHVARGKDGTTPTPHAAGTTMVPAAGQTIAGDYTWFMDLVITNSEPTRVIQSEGSDPPDRRRGSVSVVGTGNKVINCVIHDTGEGIGSFSQDAESEFYGNVIFHTGWLAPDRGHGTGMYLQNQSAYKFVKENIIFSTFQPFGMKVFGSGESYADNFTFEGNVFFNDGFLWGGSAPLRNLTLRSNYTYPSEGNAFIVGYWTDGQNIRIEDNYFGGGLSMRRLKNVSFSGNTIGSKIAVWYTAEGNQYTDYTFEGNTYYQSTVTPNVQSVIIPPGETEKQGLSVTAWKGLGYDATSTFQPHPPQGAMAFVRPNAYDAGRAHLIIYNWDNLHTVTVPAAEIQKHLTPGEAFTLINVQDYFDDRVVGFYNGGDLEVDMVNRTTSTPIGHQKLEPSTFPAFGVFVVINEGRVPRERMQYQAFLPSVQVGSTILEESGPKK